MFPSSGHGRRDRDDHIIEHLETEFIIALVSKETMPNFKDTHDGRYPVFQKNYYAPLPKEKQFIFFVYFKNILFIYF